MDKHISPVPNTVDISNNVGSTRSMDIRCLRRRQRILCLLAIFFILSILQICINTYFSYTFSPIQEEAGLKDPRQPESLPKNGKKSQVPNTFFSSKVPSTVKDGEPKLPGLPKDILNLFPCKDYSPDTISAITRARTSECKREIANISCLILQNKLYSQSLPRYCVQKNAAERETKLGCYEVDPKIFKPPVESKQYKESRTSVSRCIDLCLLGGKTYAGINYKDCVCGIKFPVSAKRMYESDCRIKCGANDTCNPQVVSVYTTGVAARIKNNDNILHISNSTNQSRVRIVFLMTLNGRAVRQIKRLLKLIYRPHHYYYIHVDERQDYLPRMLEDLEIKFPNIKLATQRFPTMWGGTTLLTMLLKCIEDLLEKSEWKWDFITNLSETDFPIKSIDILEQYIATNKGKNFVKSHGYNTFQFIKKQGLDRTFHQCDDHMWKLGPRRLPQGIVLDGGSDWIGLSRDFCDYVITGDDDLLNRLKYIFRYTLLPAETFFHTILVNSDFCHTVVDNNLRITNWRRSRGCKCQYKHIVDWCGCSPNDFILEDWKKLMGLENKAHFFSRKYEASVCQEIINKVENSLGIVQHTDHPAYSSFWQSEYHHLDNFPVWDDAKLSIYQGLSRVSLRYLKYSTKNGDHDAACSINPVLIKEVLLHKNFDKYIGTIVQFEANVSAENRKIVILECLVHPIPRTVINELSSDLKRLKSVKIGTDYDLKENIFRNNAQVIGINSDLVVETRWDKADSEFVVSMVWLDPTGSVAVSYDSKIRKSTELINHQPTLRHPLLPGEWKLKLVYKNQLAAEVTFTVFPIAERNGKILSSQEKAISVNGGPGNYTDYDFEHVEKIWSSDIKEELKIKANENSRKYGIELTKWVDTLIVNQFIIKDLCYHNENENIQNAFPCSNIAIEPCLATAWSSFYPDPKSEISGNIDSKMGYLV